MIVALVGRRVDAQDASTPRFPESCVGPVRERIRRLLDEVGATGLVCSGACGADLLALDVAGDLQIRRRMILPFAPDRFRESSVVDRPGNWGPLFDRVAGEIAEAGDLVVLGHSGDDQAAYQAANAAILDEAVRLAGEFPDTGVLAAIVWDGRSRGHGDLTESFAREAEGRGLRVVQLSTCEDGLLPEAAPGVGDPPDDRPAEA